MSDPTKAEKTFAKLLVTRFGGELNVRAYGDEPERSSVDILCCTNAPQPGLTTYATLTLHRHKNWVGKPRKNVPVNLIWMTRTKQAKDAAALSTAAFCIINSRWSCAPGVVFPDVIKMYSLSRTMKHVYFTPPIPWDRELGRVKIGRTMAHCLSMIPISEAEYCYAEEHGGDALSDLLAEAEVDFTDLKRKSVV
jgi:antitoxin YqcF